LRDSGNDRRHEQCGTARGDAPGIDLIKQQEELSKQAGAEAESNWLAAAEAALAQE
jgi:hypothetical protein